MSQRDASTLSALVDTASQLTEAASATQSFLAALEERSWAKLSGDQQLASLSRLESINQSFSRQLSVGLPPAIAPDLRVAEHGVFLRALKAGHDYVSSAADAASNLAYLDKGQVERETPKWVARIIATGDKYAAARKALDRALAELKSKYGS